MSGGWGNDPIGVVPKTSPHADWGNDALQGAAPAKSSSMSAGDVALGAVENLPSSAGSFLSSIYQTVRHPVDTATAITNVGRGAGQELTHAVLGDKPAEKTEQEQAFDAMKNYFGSRYGSAEGFKKAIATDPVGVMTDIASVMEPAGLAKNVPGKVGKVASAVSKASNYVNPASLGGKVIGAAAKPVGNLAADVIGHLGTHTGADSLKFAYQAGRAGGDASEVFLDNMRGNAPVEDVVSSAKEAVANMRREKGKQYRGNMADVAKDQTVIDFKPIDDAMADVEKIKKYKGQDIQPETAETRKQVQGIIDHWKGLPRTEFHTAEGMDALKQRIGSVMENLPYNSPQRSVAEAAYNSVKKEIVKQFPAYSKAMKDYSTASDLISEVERSLSLGKKASADTALRKLQSIMRNNVNTNYGQRAKLGEELSKRGAPNLQHALAGQALSKATPRGLGGAVAGSELGGASMAALLGHPGVLAAAIPTLALQSPRLMGEAAHGSGVLAKYLATPAGKAALKAITKGAPYAAEAGRVPDITNLVTSPGF